MGPSRGARRPHENLGTYSHLRNLSSYSDVTCMMCSTIIFAKEATLITRRWKRTEHVEEEARCIVGVFCEKHLGCRCIVGVLQVEDETRCIVGV